MAKFNKTSPSCRDCFNAFLVDGAEFDGKYDFPKIKKCDVIPSNLIVFSAMNKVKKEQRKNYYIHFYEYDCNFVDVWNRPKYYLKRFKEFGGIISPDFSTYRDMPYNIQLNNIYRSRALSYWYQKNGITVIPNIRYGDSRTYFESCRGIEQGGTIAIGSYGTLKCSDDKKIFVEGLKVIIDNIRPNNIIVYGSAPDKIFGEYKEQGINVISFTSEFAKFHEGSEA